MFTFRYRKSRDNLSSSDVKLSSRMPFFKYKPSGQIFRAETGLSKLTDGVKSGRSRVALGNATFKQYKLKRDMHVIDRLLGLEMVS